MPKPRTAMATQIASPSRERFVALFNRRCIASDFGLDLEVFLRDPVTHLQRSLCCPMPISAERLTDCEPLLPAQERAVAKAHKPREVA